MYINVATSNEVMSLLKKSGPIDGTIETNQMLAPDSSTLPLIQISAVASTPRRRTRWGNDICAPPDVAPD